MPKSQETIDRLFRSHHRDLITRARRVIGQDDAEDMVQEAYLKMLEGDRGEAVANARGYVSKMTCTLAIDALRRQRTHARALSENGAWFQAAAREARIAPAIEALGLALEFQAALARLPRCCRQIFFMNRILGFSHSEIAREIGVSLRTVNRKLGQALDHFDRAFELSGRSVSADATPLAAAAAPGAFTAGPSASPAVVKDAREIEIPPPRKNSPRRLPDFRGVARASIWVSRPAKPVWLLHSNSNQEASMTIRIAKRVPLNVIGRAGADCGASSSGKNG